MEIDCEYDCRMGSASSPVDFIQLDLASRLRGSGVVAANDEFFAEKENLIKPESPTHSDGDFGHKGKVYDGWETRRRREPGHDWAIVRLGCPGIVHRVVVDTSFFRGNYPPEISVEAANAEGYPSPGELVDLHWHQLVGRAPASGNKLNSYPVGDQHRWTHLRLSIYPDGGVARFRAYGEIVPDPAFLTGTIDLAALENGGRVTGCSNSFYSSPEHLIMPGVARMMSDGWENARRRDDADEYVEFRLAGAGLIHHAEIDTSYFVGNAPGWVKLSALGETDRVRPRLTRVHPAETELLPLTRVQPDTRHRFLINSPEPATRVRLDVIPDGGLSRLRLYGSLTHEALAAVQTRWRATQLLSQQP
jgi:allantoicase